jgi:pimeloyl-ACP methyl ester carboxylesterase
MPVQHVKTSVLSVAYHESGDPAGVPAILLHGFPYDVHAYEEVAPLLGEQGFRVIVPFLRGYGATRFLRSQTLRSGEQAALGNDLRELMDGLQIERALVGGYDWGGRAACVLAALWPERVLGLASCMGYNIQNIARSREPAHPDQEHRHWYQYYFHSERGRAGLAAKRFELCALLWRLWSPNWTFTDADYARSAPAFDGAGDGVAPPPGSAGHRHKFGETYERRVLPKVGHNLPQEAPRAFADAFVDLGK